MTTVAVSREVSTERLIVLPSGDSAEQQEAMALLNSVGGRVLQIYSSRVMIAEVPQRAQKEVDGFLLRVREEQALAGFDQPALGAAEALGVAAHQVRRSDEFATAKETRPNAGRSWEYAPPDLPSPVARDELGLAGTEELDLAAPPPDMSPFLIGSVAVGIIIVEGPTSALQFSQAERTKVAAEVQDGLSWLALQEPRARVTWVYDIQIVRLDILPDPTLPTDTYEPREAHWRNPTMNSLGFSPDFQGVIDYVASIRSSYNTDHAYVGFFTKYPLKHFAYAAKPRLVMHYLNDGWGPDNIAEVFTHETGHIFGCPDEYAGARTCNCTSRFGHLMELNGNCETCVANPVPCLMAKNVRELCQFTRVHLGWRDSNNDGTLDPLD